MTQSLPCAMPALTHVRWRKAGQGLAARRRTGPHNPRSLTQGFVQLLFLGSVYAYVLFFAANLIGDGSELLLLVPSLAGS